MRTTALPARAFACCYGQTTGTREGQQRGRRKAQLEETGQGGPRADPGKPGDLAGTGRIWTGRSPLFPAIDTGTGHHHADCKGPYIEILDPRHPIHVVECRTLAQRPAQMSASVPSRPAGIPLEKTPFRLRGDQAEAYKVTLFDAFPRSA